MTSLVMLLAQVPGLAAGQAGDAPRAGAEPPSREQPLFAVVPAAISVAPGLLLHGLGPLAEGDVQLAKWLFAMEGTGLALLVGAGAPIYLSGQTRQFAGPLYTLALTGAGLFSISALANLYAAVGPAFPPGVAPARLPPLELEVGYQHVVDASFPQRHAFVSLGAVARVEHVRLEAGARVSPDDGNLRVRVGGAYRLLGEPEGALGGADGTALDVELAALVHRFPSEGFTLGGGEVFLRGRHAMARLSPRLAGTFAEMGVGLALQHFVFDGPGVDDSLNDALLFTFGYGVYLGRGGPLRGEALLYYDHRKDDFPGAVKNVGGVPLGYFGLRGRVLLTARWGLSADLQVGSAWVGRVSLVYALMP
ncbi:hypothetical protein [Vitiosangium sp. GDMCC 1.1324]|uniref:hypothetical protein n=1 Tax=Vitiosangium sp. (strain GDMCC 1.1324) TaxID=2138576 RepID=UPI001E2AE272|nr:hypothetical protein [Vitiosangium sp. GDMCC 1.1324]